MKAPVTRLAYCQDLLVTPLNYTLTNFAEQTEPVSHEASNRSRRGARITPRWVWDKVRGHLVPRPPGYGVCDDPGLAKNDSSAIELGRRQ